MNEKYLYFRTQATLANDQDANQSACFPLSSFLGMHPGDDADDPGADPDRMVMYFKSMKNFDGAVDGTADGDASDDITTDVIEIDIVTDDTAKATMEDIINTFASSRKGMLVICDDLTGEKCSPLIKSLAVITVNDAIS